MGSPGDFCPGTYGLEQVLYYQHRLGNISRWDAYGVQPYAGSELASTVYGLSGGVRDWPFHVEFQIRGDDGKADAIPNYWAGVQGRNDVGLSKKKRKKIPARLAPDEDLFFTPAMRTLQHAF